MFTYHMFGSRHTKQIIRIDRSLTKEMKSMDEKVLVLENGIEDVINSSSAATSGAATSGAATSDSATSGDATSGDATSYSTSSDSK